MRIRVLGCYGNIGPETRSTAFLINDRVLLDGGAVASVLNPAEQRRIKKIILSHAHLDHVKELPFFLSNVAPDLKSPVRLYGIPEVLDQVSLHLFNDALWPDFSRIPSAGKPILRYVPIQPEKEAVVGSLRVIPVPVDHTVPCAGMILRDKDSKVVYTSDTGPTERIWKLARRFAPDAVIIETSFPARLSGKAKITKHLTTRMAADEIRKLGRYRKPVLIYHMKPEHADRIRRELSAVPGLKVIFMEQDEVYTI